MIAAIMAPPAGSLLTNPPVWHGRSIPGALFASAVAGGCSREAALMRSVTGCLKAVVVEEWSGPPAVHKPLAISTAPLDSTALSSEWQVAAFSLIGTGEGGSKLSLLMTHRPSAPTAGPGLERRGVDADGRVDASAWRHSVKSYRPADRAGDALSCVAFCGALLDEGRGAISAIGTLGGGGPPSLQVEYLRCKDLGTGLRTVSCDELLHATCEGSFWSLADLSSQGGGFIPADSTADRLLAVGMTGKASILSIGTSVGVGGEGPLPRYPLPGMRPSIGDLHLHSDPLIMASAGTRWGCAGTDAAVLLGLRNGTVLLWDARVAASGTAYAGRPAADPAGTSTAFRCGASVAGLHPLPGSPYAIIADARDTAAVVDARMLQRRVRTFAGYANSARRHGTALSPCGRFFACAGGSVADAAASASGDASGGTGSGSASGHVRIWEVGTGRLCRELLLPERLGAGLQCSFLAPAAPVQQSRRREPFSPTGTTSAGTGAWTANNAPADAPADIGCPDAEEDYGRSALEAYDLQIVVSCANGVCVAHA